MGNPTEEGGTAAGFWGGDGEYQETMTHRNKKVGLIWDQREKQQVHTWVENRFPYCYGCKLGGFVWFLPVEVSMSLTHLPGPGTPFLLLGYIVQPRQLFILSYVSCFVQYGCHLLDTCPFWRRNRDGAEGEHTGLKGGKLWLGCIIWEK